MAVGIITIMIITAIITTVGGGGAYLIWLKTRPKKMSWIAKCYQVGKGVRPAQIDKYGKTISELRVNDLIPYIQDRLTRVEKAHGTIVYKLERLNLTTNAVTADLVDAWGKDKKEVHILIQGSTATLLSKGYDQKTGTELFQPMPRERIELIKSEILIKKDKLRKEKDILQAITPWIVAGICMLGLITIVYFLSNAHVDAAEMIKEGQINAASQQVKAAEIYREALISYSSVTPKQEQVLGKQPPKPPSVE